MSTKCKIFFLGYIHSTIFISYDCLILAYTPRLYLSRSLTAQLKNNICVGTQHQNAEHHHMAQAALFLLTRLQELAQLMCQQLLLRVEAYRDSKWNITLQQSYHMVKEISSDLNYFTVNSGSKFNRVQGSCLHTTHLIH